MKIEECKMQNAGVSGNGLSFAGRARLGRRGESALDRVRVLVAILGAMCAIGSIAPSAYSQQTTTASTGTGVTSGAGMTASGGEYSLEDRRNEFGIWAASSLGLPPALGASHDRKFSILAGLRYGRVLAVWRPAAIEYTVDLVPLVVISEPKDATTGFPGGSGRLHVYGGGAVPVGFKLIFRPESRVKPFVAASSGPFYFTRQVPVVNSSRFNFYSTADLGLHIFINRANALSIGYKIGHLSNAGTGNLNPGFNSSSVYFGFSVFR